MRHDAIYKVYPEVVLIDDGAGAFDAQGNSVSIDAEKVNQAAAIIDAEATKKKVEAEAKLEKLGLTVDDLKVLGLG
jgi:hypothetical protein